MDKPNSEKTWNELTPEQVRHFYDLLADRAQKFGSTANEVWMEFAKYLFAANAGAAAGLFLLPDSSGQAWYLTAFSLFCLGSFFVGLAWFAGWSWSLHLSDRFAADFNALMRNELTLGIMDANNRQRHRSWWKYLSRWGVTISFVLLLSGGIVAARAFWSKPPTKQGTVQAPVAVPAKR